MAGVLVGGIVIGIIGVLLCFRRRKKAANAPYNTEHAYDQVQPQSPKDEKTPVVTGLRYPEEVIGNEQTTPAVWNLNPNSEEGEVESLSGRLRYPD